MDFKKFFISNILCIFLLMATIINFDINIDTAKILAMGLLIGIDIGINITEWVNKTK